MKIGVLLTRPTDDLGGWLADAAAFDAAGADALWLDPASDAEFDALAVTAALAMLTFRSLLVVTLLENPSGAGWAASSLLAPGAPARARTLATVARLSRGRLALCGDRAGPDLFRRVEDGVFERTPVDGEPERWVRTASPEGRAAWRETIAGAAEGGVAGLVVSAGPRLLDILRNPGESGDRQDLQLAQG
jgi:hypothetical protein